MPCRRGRSFAYSRSTSDGDVEVGFEGFGPWGGPGFCRRGRGFGRFPPHFHHPHHHEHFDDFGFPPHPFGPPPHFHGPPPHPHGPPPFMFHRRGHFRRGHPYAEGEEASLFSRSCMRTHVSPTEVNVIVHQTGATEETTQVTFEEGRIVVQGWQGQDCRQFYHSSLLPADIVPESAEIVIIDDRVHVCVHRRGNQQQQDEDDVVYVQPEPSAPNQREADDVEQMSGVQEGNDDADQQRNVQDFDDYVDVLEEDRLID